ncbi:Por secretion system C-terminal sorting domain-containing protein [Halpernia humi]|uniref:Por secretion system C-terminal sorting domain-containing protein n=1 Tax=Halpernia humi TaxID=493375 RepID=A0A1H6BJW5_9FLAO|nr:T9SS type A sorting domain-containing protein [Halpernia humi]SEG61029.1 Por secretion system C-terminal sorting domain-containing protein [Halpernia humi]
MKTNLFITGLLLLQTLMFGQVLVNDDFESDALGAFPSGYKLQYNGTGTANQKVVNNVVKNGAQSFQLEGKANWSAEVYKIVDFPNLVTVESWFNMDLAANGLSAGIGIGNFSVGSWGTRVSRLEFCETGNIYMTSYYNGSGPRYLLNLKYEVNKWYFIKIEHNLTTRKAKVFIDGQQLTGTIGSEVFSEFDLQKTITPIHLQLLAGNAGKARAMFDDVKVYDTNGLATVEDSTDNFIVYLSENQGEIFLKNLSAPKDFIIYDAVGNFVKGGKLLQNSISITALEPGVYFVNVTDKYGKTFSKKFLKRK